MSARPLLAARTSPGDANNDNNQSSSPGSNRQPNARPKRTLIESACSACRRRKSRCDGARPTCSRCQNLRTECHYEAEEGESRWSALRRRNQHLETERDQLRELLHFIQTCSESEAHEIFQRLRQTPFDDLSSLLLQVRDGLVTGSSLQSGSMSHPPAMANSLQPGSMSHPPAMATSAPEQRLPPIQTILDPTSGGLTAAQMPLTHSLNSNDGRESSSRDMAALSPVVQHQHQHPRHMLDTLEPSLRPATERTPQMLSHPSLSSEESAGSVGSQSIASSMDMPRPYNSPRTILLRARPQAPPPLLPDTAPS